MKVTFDRRDTTTFDFDGGDIRLAFVQYAGGERLPVIVGHDEDGDKIVTYLDGSGFDVIGYLADNGKLVEGNPGDVITIAF